MKKTIIRKAKNRENPYAQIANSALRDEVLSWPGTGLLAYLLSLPDDWEINLSDLKNRKKSGKAATRTALNELVRHGYIERRIVRNEKGRFVQFEYLLYERPILRIVGSEVIPTRDDVDNIFARAEFERGERGNYDDPGAVVGHDSR